MRCAESTDATKAPSPSGGWSEAIVTVQNAVIATSPSHEMIQPMGVFDDAGRYVHEAVLWRGRPLMIEAQAPAPVDRLSGRWIWGGVLLNHFGHFLTESLGRLWALDAVKGGVNGLVFVPKREKRDEEGLVQMQAYHRRFFELAHVGVPIRIITQPTLVDQLEVPGQGFGIGPMAAGTKTFRSFMEKRFARDVAPSGGPRLYISRSKLSAQRGGILCEARLEYLLQCAGYEVFHPQRHTLEEQIARYKGAKQIVSLDGSALHLVALTSMRNQSVAVIKRRDSHASDSIITHLASFLGVVPDVIDVIRQDWIRSDRKRADRFSFGELDFAALGNALKDAGFVENGNRWAPLTPTEAVKAIQDLGATLRRRKLTFSPLPRRMVAEREPVEELQLPIERLAPSRHDLRMVRRRQEGSEGRD